MDLKFLFFLIPFWLVGCVTTEPTLNQETYIENAPTSPTVTDQASQVAGTLLSPISHHSR